MKIIDSKIIDSGFEKFNGQKILKLNLALTRGANT